LFVFCLILLPEVSLQSGALSWEEISVWYLRVFRVHKFKHHQTLNFTVVSPDGRANCTLQGPLCFLSPVLGFWGCYPVALNDYGAIKEEILKHAMITAIFLESSPHTFPFSIFLYIYDSFCIFLQWTLFISLANFPF
jgi:hypothetical protein